MIQNSIKFVKRKNPFCYFYADNVLDSLTYNKLLETFPDIEVCKTIANENADGKSVLNTRGNAYQKFINNDKNKTWRDFINYLNSEEFLNRIRTTFLQELIITCPDIANKKWMCEEGVNTPLYSVALNCQFSKMSNLSFIEPHKDSPSKIISLLFYLPSQDYMERCGPNKELDGGTSFHTVNSPESTIDERDVYYGFSKITPKIDTIKYVPNRIGGFVRSSRSFHSVGPIVCPEGVFRDAFLINISRSEKHNERRDLFFKYYAIVGKVERILGDIKQKNILNFFN